MKTLCSIYLITMLLLNTCNSTKNNSNDNSPCDNGVKAIFVNMEGLDGCGMMLQLENEKKLEPTNLGSFEKNVTIKDGTKVWISYKVADGFASICMAGQLVELTCLEKR